MQSHQPSLETLAQPSSEPSTGAARVGVFTRTAIALHWLIALLLVGGFGLGLYMTTLRFSPLKLSLYSYHKWIGVTVFFLALARVLWRTQHRPPPLPAPMSAWQGKAAKAMHKILYVLTLALPVLGWLYSSAAGVPIVPFGVSALQLPDLVAPDKSLAVVLRVAHWTTAYLLAALVVIHVLAALAHQFILKDGLMARMNPFKRSFDA